jgi:two-component system sensor histidine kinase/response regulator
MLHERASEKHLNLAITEIPPRQHLLGDPTRLRQALLNYVTNALKFTEQGSVSVRLRVTDEADDAVRVRFEVQDTGIGIDARGRDACSRCSSRPTTRPPALRRHRTRAGHHAAPGAAHGRRRRGRQRSRGRQHLLVHGPPGAEIRHRFTGVRLLVADDEPVNREVALVQLEAAGLMVDQAADGVEAADMAAHTAYAAILMDMQMPRMDGLAATRQIRGVGQNRETPIIAMTANAFAEDRARCLAAGMNDFLTKPFVPEDLFSTVLKALEASVAMPEDAGA